MAILFLDMGLSPAGIGDRISRPVPYFLVSLKDDHCDGVIRDIDDARRPIRFKEAEISLRRRPVVARTIIPAWFKSQPGSVERDYQLGAPLLRQR